MLKLLQKLLTSETETEVLEFKQAKNSYNEDKLGRYFSALSNEANLNGKDRAWLIFGVKDDKSIVGTSISENELNHYKKEIAEHTSPRMSFVKTHRVEKDGATILMLEIPSAPKGVPVAWKGHYYGRNGESLVGLTFDEIERFRSQNDSFDWSAQIIDAASISDLSEEAITEARRQFGNKNPHFKEQIDTWDAGQFLNKAKLTIQGKITNTAILLLGKNESEHFISPARATISWILKDRDNIEKDYSHFACPFILEIGKIYAKIRNLKYRYIQDGTLFPDEVDQYDPYIIREALNNAIVHQDYTLGGKVIIVEFEEGKLSFTNLGKFIPESVESVLESDAPEPKYRNPFLANAMVNLNMIDTIGSGIKKMFNIQRCKFFPLPDYELSNKQVTVSIIGKVVDINYARKLAQLKNLNLHEIILLDKIAKGKNLSAAEIQLLKSKKLIEGRKPNFYISSHVAKNTEQQAEYIKMRGFKDEHYKKLIMEFIEKYGSATKKEIDKLVLDILPEILDKKKKDNKVRNIIYSMSKKDLCIQNEGSNRYPKWIKRLSKNDESDIN